MDVLETPLVLAKKNLPMVNQNPPQGALVSLPFAVTWLRSARMHTPSVVRWSIRLETHWPRKEPE